MRWECKRRKIHEAGVHGTTIEGGSSLWKGDRLIAIVGEWESAFMETFVFGIGKVKKLEILNWEGEMENNPLLKRGHE